MGAFIIVSPSLSNDCQRINRRRATRLPYDGSFVAIPCSHLACMISSLVAYVSYAAVSRTAVQTRSPKISYVHRHHRALRVPLAGGPANNPPHSTPSGGASLRSTCALTRRLPSMKCHLATPHRLWHYTRRGVHGACLVESCLHQAAGQFPAVITQWGCQSY